MPCNEFQKFLCRVTDLCRIEPEVAIRALASRPGAVLVAATDNNEQGEVLAARIEAIADAAICGYDRLCPQAGDWNEELRARGRA